MRGKQFSLYFPYNSDLHLSFALHKGQESKESLSTVRADTRTLQWRHCNQQASDEYV